MTTVWSSDDANAAYYPDYPDDLFDEDEYACLDPDECGYVCTGECYASSY